MTMIDFLVVGGGIAGISAGARLSELGRVLLIERESGLGYHASGRSAALWEGSYGAPAVVALNRASFADLDAGGYLSPRGLMLIGTAETRGAFADDMAKMALEPMTRDEMLARVPVLRAEVIDGAAAGTRRRWTSTRTGWCRTSPAPSARRGGEVRTGAPVTAIRRTQTGWAVTAGGEEIEARMLVDAAGAWADGVAEMAGVAPMGLSRAAARWRGYRRRAGMTSAAGR